MKTTPEQLAQAEALVRQMTTEEKLNVIVETSEAIERLGVPKYYHGNEALHGVVRPGRFTVFPQAIALAAMFDDGFLQEIADAISTESRARYHNGPEENGEQAFEGRYNGLLTFWSPDLNLARDPRWGRTAETYGEDPYLAGKNGAAFVRGLQGDDPEFLKAISTPKHFTANNEEHNRFSCNAQMSEKSLREYYLEPFRMAVAEGRCEAVMAAYNAINGVPCHGDRRLLTQILREEWGFDGYVVSDCSGVGRMWDSHHAFDDPADAAAAALNAGVDLECGGYSQFEHYYKEFLGQCLADGRITEARLNEAARRVLTARIKAGQLADENKLPWHVLPEDTIGCERHRRLAYEAAVRSAVLLKNNGILPLNPALRCAVVGNNANCVQFGDYSGVPKNKPVTPYEGISAVAGERARLVPWRRSEADTAFSAVPAEAFSCGGEPGACGSYYPNDVFGGTPLRRRDAAIDFCWDAQAPDPFIVSPAFSVLWQGEITPPGTGEYRFAVRFGGSAKCCEPELQIDGEAYTDGQPVFLRKGEPAPFTLRYVKNTDAPAVRLMWIRPSVPAEEAFAPELEAAKNADAVIAVVGLGTQYEAEGKDKTDLSLPPEQCELLRQLRSVNENLIVVVENGSAVDLRWADENAAAVLEVWYPGEQGGAAIADLLYGRVSPSGRLPISFPAKTEDLPSFDDYDVENGRAYMYAKIPPLYPFGFGLSYTRFVYSEIEASPAGASVLITNAGPMEAEEVAQLYIDSADLRDQPRLRLKGFQRLRLKPGESRRVRFPLNDESFSLFDETGLRRVFPGAYTVYIGGGQPDAETQKAAVRI